MDSDNGQYVLVDSPEALSAMLPSVEAQSRIAIDTEGNGLYRYHQRVCLMQITVDDETYIVDPLADLDLTPLLSLLRTRELIFHAADYDLRMMRATFDFVPEGAIFDTMIAAQMLGLDELGLVSVAGRFLDIELNKSGQKSNWTTRPLSDRQLAYASDDTRYLDDLADKLGAELERLGRPDWHRESCARMVTATATAGARANREGWRIKGSGTLPPEILLFIKYLWEWREGEASRSDVPPFKILGNAAIIEIAEWAAENRDTKFESVPKVPRSVRGSRYQRLLAALRQAREEPRDSWPTRPERGVREPSSPGFRKRVDFLLERCAAISKTLEMSPSVVAPRGAINQLARQGTHCPEALNNETSLMRWQIELMAADVEECNRRFPAGEVGVEGD